MAIKTLGKEYRNESEAIRALQGELAKLEEQKEARKAEVFKKLPKEVGLSSVDELIYNLAEFAGSATRKRVLGGAAKKKKRATRKKKAATKKRATKKTAGRKRVAKKAASKKKTAAKKSARKKVARKKVARKKTAAKKTGAKKRRSRAQIDEQTIARMKDAFASKMTGPEIAKQFGVSQSTVHNIKKRLGMVKA